MKISADRILTTHAGSLPRPEDLAQMMFDAADGRGDQEAFDARAADAVAEVVDRQREVGIDIISDGEMGKIGFSTYVHQHLTDMIPMEFVALDMGDCPALARQVFGGRGMQYVRQPVEAVPLQPRDPIVVQKYIADLSAALVDGDPDDAFICGISPGHHVFQFPNECYASRGDYLAAAAEALAPEYRAIVDAGFNLQLDSPDLAMACHCIVGGQQIADPLTHIEESIDVLNATLTGLPPEKVRLHLCWGNYDGPHHRDIELREILPAVLRARVGFISFEAANPRHEHEWEVWGRAPVPDDMVLIPGVIDTNNNRVEHPRLVAQRIARFVDLVGRERVVAGTDCGFETFAGFASCDPDVAWLKLQALVEGARIASSQLWGSQAEDRALTLPPL